MKEQQSTGVIKHFAEELLWNYLRTKLHGSNSEDNKHLEREHLIFLRFYIDEVKLKPEEIFQQIKTFLKGKLEISDASLT